MYFSSVTGRRDADDFKMVFVTISQAWKGETGRCFLRQTGKRRRLPGANVKCKLPAAMPISLASVGTTFTEVPGARNKEDEFFDGLRSGHGQLGGQSGSYLKLTRDIFLLCREMMREDHWTILLAPLVALVPAGVAVNYLCDLYFVRRWGNRINPAAMGVGRTVPESPKLSVHKACSPRNAEVIAMTARKVVWQYIETRDFRVMRRVNRWRAPRWLRIWMIWSSRLGDGWVWYSIGITLLLFGGDLRFAAIRCQRLSRSGHRGTVFDL